jgi:hypothetical protein
MTSTTTLGVRLGDDVLTGLRHAAKDDDRSLSSLARKVLTEWLYEKGYLIPVNTPLGSLE